MNYKELSKIPNALDKMNITNTMVGCIYYDRVSPVEGFNRLDSYINNLKKLYPDITEKELDDMINTFKEDMKKQVKFDMEAQANRKIEQVYINH